MNFRVTLALTAVFGIPVFADDSDTKLLKPFVTSQTAAVATLDLTAADVGPAVKAVLPFIPDQEWAENMGSTIEKLRGVGARRLYLVVTPYSLLPSDWV